MNQYFNINKNNQLVKSNINSLYGKDTDLVKSEDIELGRISDNLEKGGKRAQIGEVRTYSGQKWVKHQDGWVLFDQKSGNHKLERPGGKRESASAEHVTHAEKHLQRNERETGESLGEGNLSKENIKVGVIGKTTSGKDIHSGKSAKDYKDFTKQDHADARALHIGKFNSTKDKKHAILADEHNEEYSKEEPKPKQEGSNSGASRYTGIGDTLKEAHEKRGFDPSKGDVDVTGQSEKIPTEIKGSKPEDKLKKDIKRLVDAGFTEREAKSYAKRYNETGKGSPNVKTILEAPEGKKYSVSGTTYMDSRHS